MKNRLTLLLSFLFLGIGMISAQTSLITGTVLDKNNESVIGASVVVKGTTIGVITDFEGKFQLNVPSDKRTLVISLIGMKTVEVNATPNMTVVMQDNTALLDEVVVTAMGITRDRKGLGYAVQKVKADDLIQASNSDLAGALQGKIAGVQITPSSGMPGSSSQIVIRGARSFSGDNTPLYVIDGMPVTSTSDVNTDKQNNGSVSGTDFANRAVDIDPSDIESVEILKGQAASALYGLRASNGVVIITTKSGKNLTKGKAHITVSTSLSFDKISRYPSIQRQYAQGSAGKYDPTSSKSWGPLISELPNDAKYGGNTDNTYTAKWGKQEGKYYVPQLANAGLNPWATPQSYDNAKDFFDTGVTWNKSINVAQALEKTSYSVSLGSTNQDGIVPTTGMDRYTGKIGAETKLTDNWSTGFVGTYVKTSIAKAPGANDGLVATVFGAPASYNLEGIPDHYENNPYAQNNYRGGSYKNPYWSVDNNKFTEKTSRFYGNMYADYKTTFDSTDKKLNVKYQLGTDAYTTHYVESWGYGNKGNSNNGQIELYSWKNTSVNSLLTSNFEWKIDSDWTFSAVAGNEIIQSTKTYNWEYGANYNFSGWNHIGNANVLQNSSEKYSKRTVGFFANVLASYKNMVYLGATGREDYVSSMPRKNRSFFYPSVNASFVFTELDALKDRKILDFGKIRVSYAEVGQAGEYEANYYSTPVYGSGFYTFTPIAYPINGVKAYTPFYRIYDPNLKPQNTVSYEAGFDATFLKGLFDVSYTFSRQNIKDQIFDVPLAGSTGFQEIRTNAGKMHTNTHEVSLNVNPIRTKLVDWTIGLNWTKIDNYVDELASGVQSISLGGFVTPQVRAGIGYKYPVIFGVDYKRDKQGRILVDDEGLPMAGEDAVIGKVSPDFNLGLNTSVRVGKVRVSAVFDWKSGGQMYHGTKNLMDFYGVSGNTASRANGAIFNGWKENGTKNDILVTDMEYYYNVLNSIDASSVYDNSFIKLREVSVAYTAYKKSWIEIGVNAYARNIIIWSELKGYDPEASQGNNNMTGAFERFSLPSTSSYGFGVNVKF